MLLREFDEAVALRPGVAENSTGVDDPERLEQLPQAVLINICGTDESVTYTPFRVYLSRGASPRS